MILSNLRLQNFKKYRSYEIEFGEGLVGIIGKNGSGKSTIFEAILFALYGELKNKGFKEVIKNADAPTKEIVSVELEFELESVVYKVVREFRGKTLTANAKLYQENELIVSGVKEVNNAIVKLVKMNKEAFLHTLFASQKELTSLSSLKNEERKRMIRKLLGLEKIDFVEGSLIEKSRELNREIKAFNEVILSQDAIKEHNTKLETLQESHRVLDKEVVLKSTELENIQTQQSKIKKDLDELDKTKEQKQKLLNEFQLLKNSIQSQNDNLEKLKLEIKELEAKQQELKTLEPLKKEFESLQKDLEEQNKLKEFHIKKEALLKEQVGLREQYKKIKTDIALLEKECENYEQFTFDAKNLEQNISILQDTIEQKHTIEKELLAESAAEQKQIDLTNAKIEKLHELGSESACPTCTRPLLEEYDNVINSLVDAVNKTYKVKIEEYKKQLENVLVQKNDFTNQKKQKEQQYSTLMQNIRLIESKQKDLQNAKNYFVSVEQKGKLNNEDLKTLEPYSYDEAAHKTIVQKHAELQPKYKQIQALETQLLRMELLKTQHHQTVQNIEELNVTCKKKENELNAVVYDEKAHMQTKQNYENSVKGKDAKLAELNEVKLQIATLFGDIKNIQNILESDQKQREKMQEKQNNLSDYDKIKTSLAEFKTKLNAKVAPRISNIASEMFARITKGKYQHIEVNNDFDFFIYDEGRKFPIERFSGGEIDLANLVLRIAISKTLTELSGATSLGFLAFDEVFGSQDENRRIEILEAFHTIKEQYRQIFLISHEMEIKEMFERVVEL